MTGANRPEAEFQRDRLLHPKRMSYNNTWRHGREPNCYAVACRIATGRNNSGLKNRLAIAAKIMGVKPITAA